MATYDSSKPPKRVRTDRPGDSKKPYLNPFATPLPKAHKKLKSEQPHRNV